MRLIEQIYFVSIGMQMNINLLIGGTVASFILFAYTNTYKTKFIGTFTYSVLASNYFLTSVLLVLTSAFILNFYTYIHTYIALWEESFFEPELLYHPSYIAETLIGSSALSFYGYIIILLALFVGLFALLASENKIKSGNLNFLFYFNYFLLVVYAFVSVTDIISLFICYELLLIPSFFFVYFISYTCKALQACLYFVVWTQVGSLLVLIATLYIVNLVGGAEYDSLRGFHFTKQEAMFIYTLLFFGFGLKFPIWPFHYWLTKTHVEASSGFSIYLSGFLVKSALFGFFTITNLLKAEFQTTIFGVIAFLGCIDASLKMWGQSDLKKLVAYCTIQEMNLIVVTFLLGDTRVCMAGIMFSAAHAFLSALMFYLVDCIYRRMHSRSVYQVQGLLHLTPNLAIAIFIMCVLYAGLPGTIKFSCEFFIFSSLAESSLLTMIFLMFVMNVLGLIGFSKPWFNVIFGLPNKNLQRPVPDLSRREIYLIGFPICFFVFFTYFSLPLL